MPRRRARVSRLSHRLADEPRDDLGRNGDAKSACVHALDADDGAVERGEWTAGVAWRQSNVGRQEYVVAVRRGMNDTEAQRAADTEWMPERNDDLAHSDRARIANRCRRRPGVRQIGKRDEGEIVIAVARNHSCLDHTPIHALDKRGITAPRR